MDIPTREQERIVKVMTQEDIKKAVTYNPDTGLFTRNVAWGSKPAGSSIGSKPLSGYILVGIYGEVFKAHYLAWIYMFGSTQGKEIDHINHDGTDNRLCNLRLVSHADNMMNQRMYKNNTSGVTGVNWSNQASKWHAQIQVGGKKKHLGFFSDKNKAVLARKEAEEYLGFHPNHGE